MPNPLISVVIIEYFSLEELDLCIDGIEKSLSGINFEIIISSNSCYDNNKITYVRSKFPSVVFSFNERNGGFAYGMNKGLSLARGRYIAIANPDTIVRKGFRGMIRFMEDHQDIGAVGPQIISSEGIIQDSCRKYVSLQNFIARQIRRKFLDIPVREADIDHKLIQTVDWISGGFMVVSRSAYKATGGLDENYFLYAEDIDWCTRIRKAGFEIVYYPPMEVLFSGSRTARKLNKYTWIFLKSHFRYWMKFGFFSGYPKRLEKVFDK
jgi:N-acetylglucosaminyl-diphospho-decaprenol L-rhamnosyltransferase